MILNKGVDDEVFILKSFEMKIMISELINFINSNWDLFEVIECETDVLLNLNGSDYINPSSLNFMSEFRMDEPVLVTKINGYDFIIDGNHRLQKRKLFSRFKTKYIPINGELLDHFVREFSIR